MPRLSSDHKCVPIANDDPFLRLPESERPSLESIEATFSDRGDEVTFLTGYSALQIALSRAAAVGGNVYTNNISPEIRRKDLNRPVSYAVCKSPVFTLMPPDEEGGSIFRCYWPEYRH